MILPIRTAVIYIVLFCLYVESILFFDSMLPIFLRWHNNPLKPDNSYDGSLFIDLFMLCYFLLLAVDYFPMNTLMCCVSVLVSFEIYIP